MTGLMSENQAAEVLQVTPRALQAWRTRGGGPAYLRISHRCVRYRPEDLEQWLEDRRFESTAQEDRYSTEEAA